MSLQTSTHSHRTGTDGPGLHPETYSFGEDEWEESRYLQLYATGMGVLLDPHPPPTPPLPHSLTHHMLGFYVFLTTQYITYMYFNAFLVLVVKLMVHTYRYLKLHKLFLK